MVARGQNSMARGFDSAIRLGGHTRSLAPAAGQLLFKPGKHRPSIAQPADSTQNNGQRHCTGPTPRFRDTRGSSGEPQYQDRTGYRARPALGGRTDRREVSCPRQRQQAWSRRRQWGDDRRGSGSREGVRDHGRDSRGRQAIGCQVPRSVPASANLGGEMADVASGLDAEA